MRIFIDMLIFVFAVIDSSIQAVDEISSILDKAMRRNEEGQMRQ